METTTKKKKKKIIPFVKAKIDIPFGCFMWEGRLVIDGVITPVWAIMNAEGKIISCEDIEGNYLSLPLLKPANKTNVLFSRAARAELGKRYGFTKA